VAGFPRLQRFTDDKWLLFHDYNGLLMTGRSIYKIIGLVGFWCFNATFSNVSAISWRTVVVVEEAANVPRLHRPKHDHQKSHLCLKGKNHYLNVINKISNDKLYQLLAHGRWFSVMSCR
jgi:hypothetical protein